MKSKSVKILFNTVSKNQWSKSAHLAERLSPFYEITEILKFINKLSKKNRFRDLPEDKFCFLESISEKNIENKKVIFGSFKSARNQFRPNLINKTTGFERTNPKLLTEGDIEKTHFAIVIDKIENEVFFLLEYNYHGLTMNNIVDYLKFFNGRYLKEKNLPKNYTLLYSTIAKEGFIESLKTIKTAKIAEVHFDKQLLGSDSLNFSNRLVSLKNDLKLIIKANTSESLKETAVDLYNVFKSGKGKISKIRITGTDQKDNDVLLDTSFMNKVEFLEIDRNSATGELNSTQIFSGLKTLIQDM